MWALILLDFDAFIYLLNYVLKADVDIDLFVVQRPEHVRITDFGLAKLLNNKQAMFSTTGEKVSHMSSFRLFVLAEKLRAVT